ncbi:MAG TPA: ABC transporter ATP-binding protein [Candidatus Nanoarchaeia archaeon]|nr:ABC transporter ATP-binding protein [Candidatus Nanoarchaeia archaeon]
MILDIKNITVAFGGIVALNKCSCKIQKSKITAIIGPNGSGKSTLFNVISGLIPPDEGSIRFEHTDITKNKEHKIARLGISRTFQDVRLFKNLSIKDHLEIAMSTSDEKLLPSLKDGKPDNTKEIHHLLGLVGLKKPLNTVAIELSYGQRKLLDLAVALAKPHSVIMLDEPVAGVNPQLRKDIKEVLRKLNKQGETILVIEHDMNFVMDLAEHIIVMDEGKVLVEGTPEKVRKDKRVLEAYLGE